MAKFYEGLSVLQARWLIEENEDSAKRMFKRYVNTAKSRAKTFEKHGMTSSYGYRRLRDTLNEAKGGFSAEALSHVSFTLASAHTSWQGQREIDRKTIDTLNVEFGTWDDSGERLIKPFITESQFKKFTELMDLLKTLLVEDPSDLVAKNSAAFVEIVASKGFDFDEEVGKLKQAIDKATTNNQKFSMNRYVSTMRRRKARK